MACYQGDDGGTRCKCDTCRTVLHKRDQGPHIDSPFCNLLTNTVVMIPMLAAGPRSALHDQSVSNSTLHAHQELHIRMCAAVFKAAEGCAAVQALKPFLQAPVSK